MQNEIVHGHDLSGKRSLLGIPRDSAFVLLLHGKDRDIEPLWKWQDNVIAAIKSGKFDLVVPPDFSIMWDEPRFEHLVNMRRTLQFFRLLQDNDIPTVPHLFWYRDIDLHRHIEWLTSNPCVSTIAINLQLGREDEVWRHFLDGLRRLQTELPRRLHFLLCGVSDPARIFEARSWLARSAFTSLTPYMLAVHRRRLCIRQNHVIRERRSASAPRALLRQNIRTVAELVHRGRPPCRRQSSKPSAPRGRRARKVPLLVPELD